MGIRFDWDLNGWSRITAAVCGSVDHSSLASAIICMAKSELGAETFDIDDFDDDDDDDAGRVDEEFPWSVSRLE